MAPWLRDAVAHTRPTSLLAAAASLVLITAAPARSDSATIESNGIVVYKKYWDPVVKEVREFAAVDFSCAPAQIAVGLIHKSGHHPDRVSAVGCGRRGIYERRVPSGRWAVKIQMRANPKAFRWHLAGPVGVDAATGTASQSRPSAPTQRPPRAQAITATGTCFAVHPEGLILTAFHVVEGASAIEVAFPDRESMPASLRASSRTSDLALLAVKDDLNLSLALAPPRSVTLGQHVFTIGYPARQALGDEPKYTDGTVSALSGIDGDASLLQISVPIQPGNSGGPLVNREGQVVGIVTSSAAVATFIHMTGTLPQNVNWAVKSEHAMTLFDPPPAPASARDRDATIEVVRRATCAVEARR